MTWFKKLFKKSKEECNGVHKRAPEELHAETCEPPAPGPAHALRSNSTDAAVSARSPAATEPEAKPTEVAANGNSIIERTTPRRAPPASLMLSTASAPSRPSPRRSIERLAPLPDVPVEAMAEAHFTRSITRNIAMLAQAQGAAGASSVALPSGVSIVPAEGRSCNFAPSTSYGLSTLSHSSYDRAGSAPGPVGQPNDDSEDIEVQLPSVVPPALLEEAARGGVDLQLDLSADVELTPDVPPLGRGVSGTVFKGAFRGQPCAVKMLPPEMLLGSGAELHTFVQEMVVLAGIRHANVVSFYGGSMTPPNIFFVEELCQRSLDAWLHGGGGREPMTPRQRLKVALDVASGLQYLHERTPAIVHRDLKPANILLAADGTAKISDFGLARIKTTAVINTRAPAVGSIGYAAPECFTGDELTDKCDTWSLGVVLWETMARQRPWPGMTLREYYKTIVVKRTRLPIPTDDAVCPLALRKLISSCWNDAPDDRPSCGHIVGELTRMLKYAPRDD